MMDAGVEEATLDVETIVHEEDVTDSTAVRVDVGQERVL